MTAAEKRERFETEWLSVLQAAHNDYDSNFRGEAKLVANLLTFTDDAPAPAAPVDWRDEVVSWGTGWEKRGLSSAIKRTGRDTYWQVFKDGSLSFYKADVTGKDHLGYGSHIMGAPVSRCRTIDRFLAELAGEGVKS